MQMQEMTGLLAQHGLALVFANVLLSQLGVPLPAVPMLIIAGAFVVQGQIALVPLLLVVVVASLMGDTPWYLAGRRYGYRVLGMLCRVAIEPDTCVKQTENVFERWGAPSLIVAKFVPGFATVAPPLAGAMRLGAPRFAAYSALSALLWAAVPVAAGAAFHAQVDWVLQRLDDMGTRALWLIAAIVAFYLGVKLLERHLLIRMLRTVRVNAQQLRDMIDEGLDPLILDARSAAARRLDPRHILGAIPVNMAAPEANLGAVLPDRDVVVYCS
jgi:membrane protein DedA with SNARE-associated domain